MKLAIISDIHANLEALQATLQDISAQAVDRIVCLGDIVGYNANPAACISLLRESDVLCIAGNHDRAVTGHITTEGFSHAAARAVAWTRGQLSADAIAFLAGLPLKLRIDNHLVMVHGALHPQFGCEQVRLVNDDLRRLSFEALATDPSGAHVCAFGNTHRLGIFELRNDEIRARTGDEVFLREEAYYLINPGTVGRPLTADLRATYFLFDVARHVIAVQRVAYDASASRAKSRAAGLLDRSSFLPSGIRTPIKWGAKALGVYDWMKRSGW
jgi:predicted phosphodiesterase